MARTPDPLLNWRYVAHPDRARLGFPFRIADTLYSHTKTDIWLARFTGWTQHGEFIAWWSIIHNGKRTDHDGCGSIMADDGAIEWANGFLAGAR